MMKKLGIFFAVIAHLLPIGINYALDGAYLYASTHYNPISTILAYALCPLVYGIFYVGALMLLGRSRLPVGVAAAGLVGSILYGAVFFYLGLFWNLGRYALVEPFAMVALLIPFWGGLLVRSLRYRHR